MEKFDAVIIGSGLGGLSCGAILSKEGLNVCLLEQQAHLGGCLQSFVRKGYSLDTGMHYAGSLSEGNTLHQYFKYFGILDQIRYCALDSDGFDIIDFGEGRSYAHAIGHEHFIETLSADFPEEREGLTAYAALLQKIGGYIKPEVLRSGNFSGGGEEYMGISAYATINRLFRSDLLKNIIAGSIPFYGYDRQKSSMYEHGMIHNSYIEGAYRFTDNTQHVADALAAVIRNNGGTVMPRSQVTGIDVSGGRVRSVEISNGLQLATDCVISAIHPSVTLSLLKHNEVIRKAFFTRIHSLKNSFGLFTTYLLLKPDTFQYLNRNYYLYNTRDVWNRKAYFQGCQIPMVLMSCQHHAGSAYASVVTLMTPMDYTLLSPWENSTTGNRPDSYNEFKERFAQAMTDFVLQHFPQLKSCIAGVCTASPLTYRDFNSTPYGSAYGIIKDCTCPMISHLSPRTKIDNLYFTGQNLNVHGCLGTTVSAAVTCSEILGKEYLAKKIGNE